MKPYPNQYLYLKWLILGFASVCLCTSCTEPFTGEVGGVDDVLVVNALITNENTQHEVRLSRPYSFQENAPVPEENAMVSVAFEGEEITYEEVAPGKYISSVAFAAQTDIPYRLFITLQNGVKYTSETMQLPVSSTQIDDLYAQRIVDNDGVAGVGIFVDTFNAANDSKYYRYEYEETFKIIAPFWSPQDVVFVIQLSTGPVFNVIRREREERVCYGSDTEKVINIVNTLNLAEDRLSGYTVRFINSDNYILSHRYSILVRQYVQTPASFAYYDTLKGLSQTSTSVFTEDQPGFLAGNVFAVSNSNEKVAGFFEVATVTEKRIFFDYEDLFPGEDLPPYFQSCIPAVQDGEDLKSTLARGERVYFDGNFSTVPAACGDCNVLGSNRIPEFWIE